jgi:lipopolysaccharide biosynthesis glycosyltransferase
MKNLIYTICDNNYKQLLHLWLHGIKKYNSDVDILIICPENLDIDDNVLTHRVLNFDYKYSAKFLIGQYKNIKDYKNILYLDLDIVCKNSLSPVFSIIENNNKVINGVIEKASLKNSDHFHRYSDAYTYLIKDNWLAFNAGTFGFSINIVEVFKEYLDYTSEHLDKLCDQPIFNMFFNGNNLIVPTLSDYVYLHNYSINTKSIEEYPLIHFLGDYGNAQIKINNIKSYV